MTISNVPGDPSYIGEHPLVKSAGCADSQLKAAPPAADNRRRLPIDRPCSACSAGDVEMKHHLHCPPFREGVAEELTQTAKRFSQALCEHFKLYDEESKDAVYVCFLRAIKGYAEEAIASRDRELTHIDSMWKRSEEGRITAEREFAELRARIRRSHHVLCSMTSPEHDLGANGCMCKVAFGDELKRTESQLAAAHAALAIAITWCPVCKGSGVRPMALSEIPGTALNDGCSEGVTACECLEQRKALSSSAPAADAPEPHINSWLPEDVTSPDFWLIATISPYYSAVEKALAQQLIDHDNHDAQVAAKALRDAGDNVPLWLTQASSAKWLYDRAKLVESRAAGTAKEKP